jgi:hypothetical protein
MNRRRPLAILAVALALAGAIDFAQRVHVGRNDELRQFIAPAAQPLPAAEPAEASAARLARWLPETAAGGAGDPGAARLELRLVGVMAGRGATLAIIATVLPEGQPGRSFRVAEGDVVEGLRVVRIEPRRVTLEGDTGSRQLVLFERTPAGAKASKPQQRKKREKPPADRQAPDKRASQQPRKTSQNRETRDASGTKAPPSRPE